MRTEERIVNSLNDLIARHDVEICAANKSALDQAKRARDYKIKADVITQKNVQLKSSLKRAYDNNMHCVFSGVIFGCIITFVIYQLV